MRDIRKCNIVIERNCRYMIYYFDGLFILKVNGVEHGFGTLKQAQDATKNY